MEMAKFKVELDAKTIKELEQALEEIPDIEAEMDRAEEAGIDVTELREELQKAKESIERILAVYGH